MRVDNSVVFTSADMSTTQTSNAFSVNQIYGWSASFQYTGAPVGTLKIQVSNDPGSLSIYDKQAPTNWDDMANSSVSISAAGSNTYNVNLGFYNWIRFVYTASSGTGSLNGRLNLKGV